MNPLVITGSVLTAAHQVTKRETNIDLTKRFCAHFAKLKFKVNSHKNQDPI
jgi:hypothetical protein